MAKRITCIIALLFSIFAGGILVACTGQGEQKTTFTVTYSANEGGYVYYINEYGYEVTSGTHESKHDIEFNVESGEDIIEIATKPNIGYAFEKWSDGVTTATRQDTNVSSDISVHAIFVRSDYLITYAAVTVEGYIDGKSSQRVAPNADAEQVTAVPNKGYLFVRWSDGVTTATRQDIDITSDVNISAIFKRNTYTLKYRAGENGSIVGETDQAVLFDDDGSTVTAVPDKGYEFVEWSDGVTTAERKEVEVSESIQVVAEFAPITREYDLNYRKTFDNEINKPKFTLTYDALDGVKLPVPEREHFIFGGWYYGEQKVADENGNLVIDDDFVLDDVIILNYYGRRREQDIRAKWTAEETFPFKILLVYVTKIQACLKDQYGMYHDIDYTMTDLERRFCAATTQLLKQTMDEMCDGLVDFQIDEYYTTQTITTECFKQSGGGTTGVHTYLFPSQIPEIQSIISEYYCVESVFGFGGDESFESAHLFQSASGMAFKNGCSVFLDYYIYNATMDHNTMEVYEITDIINGQLREQWVDSLEPFIHEIAHTIETRINSYEYHFACCNNADGNGLSRLVLNRLYYTCSIEQDGELVGIPYEFWKYGVVDVICEVNDDQMGYVDRPCQGVARGLDAVPVTAKPLPGCRFVRWSDGVATPERKDRNVTTDLNVTAIFEPIVYTIRVVASEGGSLRKFRSSELHAEIVTTVKMREETEYVYAVAQDGYRFVGWSDGTKSDLWSKFIQITDVDMFDENDTYVLTAIFEKIS